MPKLLKQEYTENGELKITYLYWCPGCNKPHAFSPLIHNFNGDVENPTVSPSLLTKGEVRVCHSFLKEGRMQFLSDCSHPLKGQTVELPDFKEAATKNGKEYLLD